MLFITLMLLATLQLQSFTENELLNLGRRELIWPDVLTLSEKQIDENIIKLKNTATDYRLDQQNILKMLKDELNQCAVYHKKRVNNTRDENKLWQAATAAAAALLVGCGLYYYFSNHSYWNDKNKLNSMTAKLEENHIKVIYTSRFGSLTDVTFQNTQDLSHADREFYANMLTRFVELLNATEKNKNIWEHMLVSSAIPGILGVVAGSLAMDGLDPKHKEHYDKYQLLVDKLNAALK